MWLTDVYNQSTTHMFLLSVMNRLILFSDQTSVLYGNLISVPNGMSFGFLNLFSFHIAPIESFV